MRGRIRVREVFCAGPQMPEEHAETPAANGGLLSGLPLPLEMRSNFERRISKLFALFNGKRMGRLTKIDEK